MGKPDTVHVIEYGRRQIPYELVRRDRRTLQISVHPNLSVTVVAPRVANIRRVREIVRSKARWVVHQQDFFRTFLPKMPPKQYVSGESHRYLGRQYRLKIVKAADERVKLDGKYLKVFTKNSGDRTRTRLLLDRWYRERAGTKFPERLAVCHERARKYGITDSPLSIRKMPRRWGSCTNGRHIYLNPELIKTTLQCIDYVIIHECCHLKVPRHTIRFYDLLSRIMPDWRKRKEKLERIEL
ncbi:MAG: hypothetical protein A3G34_01810 [Candidatus Lindowbacteria bacterium RIFCSPLOWO2_12_FULL_62_27]|nr:MAG: hypothetical protein A3I06_05755 [Candidatus Lindowbacteria bacterium RIFCSPLOWO2_02_FULL_62_12]OGH59045.1 MAG: hypothetical protein A3G34_01810 [Candidatus Lindowbacteria bacterium RIFCSPLOWO2_12_FULL_62_27]